MYIESTTIRDILQNDPPIDQDNCTFQQKAWFDYILGILLIFGVIISYIPQYPLQIFRIFQTFLQRKIHKDYKEEDKQRYQLDSCLSIEFQVFFSKSRRS
jgi:hypothetical protein